MEQQISLDFRKNKTKKLKGFKFIDLFCGIGGFRISAEELNGNCVFSSEIDETAIKTYEENFNEKPSGDIKKIKANSIPDHDVLLAGFPCQAFSVGGFRKGFADKRGTLFFEIERILKNKKPKAFLLENVKGLYTHDKGRTFKIIRKSLENLGYKIYYKILNSKNFGVPQNRERIYIVGFLLQKDFFDFPESIKLRKNLNDIIEIGINSRKISSIGLRHIKNNLKIYKKKHQVNGLDNLIATQIRPNDCSFKNDGIAPCLVAKMGTGGNNVPVIVKQMRFLTARECLRLMGFKDTFKIGNSSKNFLNIGNSVVVPLVKKILKNLLYCI